MTRGQINALIRDAKASFAEHLFLLPPFARWTPACRSLGNESPPAASRPSR